MCLTSELEMGCMVPCSGEWVGADTVRCCSRREGGEVRLEKRRKISGGKEEEKKTLITANNSFVVYGFSFELL